MIFTSFEFVFFFLAVAFIRNQIRNFSAEKWFLMIASYVFYMSWSVPCGFLIFGTSLIDYFLGARLGRTENPFHRKCLLVTSLSMNLGILAYFKYTNFFVNSVFSGLSLFGAHLSPVHYNIILPAGISFFTFQSMSYTIDVYRRHIDPCKSLRDFVLFVAFFPQLLAGPIVRASQLLPQLQQRIRASVEDIEIGLCLFAVGAVKKIVISDQISPHVDLIFASPAKYDACTLLQGILGYAVQIYCDFSGYTDMAIGCARMLGFRFPENFQMPYSALTITEFWRRWHISLSSWLRDYIYIPLGGNRLGTVRTYANLMITMLLGGLWHGASWNFIIWGALHGVCLAIHKAWLTWRPVPPGDNPGSFLTITASRVLTLGLVLLGWVFFRAQSFGDALSVIEGLFHWNRGTRFFSPHIIAAVFAVFAIHVAINKDRNWVQELVERSLPIRVLGYSTLLLLLVCLGATDSAPFIYFQF
jgi:alginate O-acetyltransferase complex protein AlgI